VVGALVALATVEDVRREDAFVGAGDGLHAGSFGQSLLVLWT